MPLIVTCPACGREGTVPDNTAGRRGTCPACKAAFIIQVAAEDVPVLYEAEEEIPTAAPAEEMPTARPLPDRPRRRNRPPDPGRPVLVAEGIGARVELYPGRIRIVRRGFIAALSGNLTKGDKEIAVAAITSIQLKRAGMLNGYIQFAYPGSQESKKGLWDATQDENSVFFNSRQQPDFEELKEEIDRMRFAPPPPARGRSDADELEKLANLLDRGLITRAEFEAKKRDILGL